MLELEVTKFVSQFKETKKFPIKIVAKNNVNGILSSIILIKAFQKEKYNFSLSLEDEIKDQSLLELNYDSSKSIIFLGSGSEKISQIKSLIKDKIIFIIDNSDKVDRNFNINILNPCLENNFISLSGLSYLFAKELNKTNFGMGYLGFIGSLIEPSSFDTFLLESALKSNKLIVAKSLEGFYGRTLDLKDVLMNSYFPFFPELSGSGNEVSRFLKNNKLENKKFMDLSDEELKRLYSAVLITMLGKITKREIFGSVYLLKEEKDDSIIKDVHGLIEVIDSCCKMNKGSFVISSFLGDKTFKREILFYFDSFKEEMIKFLKWINNKRKDEKNNLIILNLESNFKEYIIEKGLEIVRKSLIFEKGIFLSVINYTMDGDANIRILLSTIENEQDKLFENLAKDLGLKDYIINEGLYFTISQSYEEEFMKKLVLKLENKKIEEIVK